MDGMIIPRYVSYYYKYNILQYMSSSNDGCSLEQILHPLHRLPLLLRLQQAAVFLHEYREFFQEGFGDRDGVLHAVIQTLPEGVQAPGQ